MEQDRQEVYERIPWESLERRHPDRQWLVIAVAGAVAVASLAYSFIRSQPVVDPSPASLAAPGMPPTIPPAAPPAPSPMVVAEADLFALDPERLIDQVAAHAAWFATEYFSVDGSEESRAVLASLLPAGVPMPQAPADIRVFVDWVGVQSVFERSALTYVVEVLVRSLVAGSDHVFTRQPARLATVEITIGADGRPRVTSPPSMAVLQAPSQHSMGLVAVPAHIAGQFASSGSVVGGVQQPDGRWMVVIMSIGPDGVTRPVSASSS